jgi:hypothetical protein
MPRQLPWMSKGGGSRTQTKQPPKSVQRSRIQNDIDDDFFEDTVLASSRKDEEGGCTSPLYEPGITSNSPQYCVSLMMTCLGSQILAAENRARAKKQ